MLNLPWSDFKSHVVDKRNLIIEYIIKGNNQYYIWSQDDNIIFVCNIEIKEPAGTDQLDFENNYKDNANKEHFSRGIDFYAENGIGFELMADVTDIDTGSFTQIVTRTVPTNHIDLYTDICFSATQNGIVRMKVDGNIICTKYYGAYQEYKCARITPWKMNSGSVMVMEYKPDVDGACAACNAGGYSKNE